MVQPPDDSRRILVIFGTRPEAIKLAPVIQQLRQHPGQICARVCVTAQHRAMLDQALNLFDIAPDIDLDLMQRDQTPTQVASRVLERLEPVLREERPDWVLVQGDTTTVMAATIAAHHQRIAVGHVEAGLRTGDKDNPFPEESNRLIADHLSTLCFAPTVRARDNLLRDGIPESAIRLTGNTVVDALLDISNRPWTPGPHSPLHDVPDGSRLILVTSHRRESFGAPLERICRALKEIAQRGRGTLRLVYPVHPNPNVQETVYRLLGGVSNIFLIPPVDYLEMVNLMKRSALILTDSGGIQEEAPGLKVPVLVLRETTERPEGVEAGVARIVGTDPDRIAAEALRLLENPDEYARMTQANNPYGDGHAAERIVEAILNS
jgi:UDP-N-acetylglucosamine 2-epimerase (non-hydrolysing)